MKEILVISNLTLNGNVNLNTILNVMSSFDFKISILPLSITPTIDSNNTIDETDNLENIINEFKEKNIKFDSIYLSGIHNRESEKYIIMIKEELLKENGLFIVDPNIGKNGSLLEKYDEGIIMSMMNIVSISDYVLPNITEAMLLTNNRKYEDIQDDYYVNELISDLYRNGSKNVILTSYQDDEYSIGCVAYDGLTKTTVLKEKMDSNLLGVGDIFKAYVASTIILGKPIKESLDLATEFVMASIDDTLTNYNNSKEIIFENSLKDYTHIKPNPGWN